MIPLGGSADGVETAVLSSSIRGGFRVSSRVTSHEKRPHGIVSTPSSPVFVVIWKSAWTCSSPRRIRTRSARYAAALGEQLGLITRPKCCSWCRRRQRLERHHWDYDEPLNVTFLCADCHAIADSMVGDCLILLDPQASDGWFTAVGGARPLDRRLARPGWADSGESDVEGRPPAGGGVPAEFAAGLRPMRRRGGGPARGPVPPAGRNRTGRTGAPHRSR